MGGGKGGLEHPNMKRKQDGDFLSLSLSLRAGSPSLSCDVRGREAVKSSGGNPAEETPSLAVSLPPPASASAHHTTPTRADSTRGFVSPLCRSQGTPPPSPQPSSTPLQPGALVCAGAPCEPGCVWRR